MKTTAYWGANILGRWFSLALIPALAVAADVAPTRLGQGIDAYNVHDYSGAAQHLRGAEVPKLADYVAYYLGSSELQTGDIDGAVRELAAYRANPVASSPLAGKIALLYAHALLDQKQPASSAKALETLQADYKILPQPEGDFALAMAFEAQGEKLQAALAYVKVFYAWPNTDLAAQAFTAIERLRPVIGKDFPAAPARQQLDRCQKWLDAKQYVKARTEYTTLASTLPEPQRDEAKVGAGAAEFLSGDVFGALKYLKELKLALPEAEAERLYYLTEAARKTSDDAGMIEAVNQLNQRHTASPWRLKALITAGNRYVLTNEREKYTPLFKAASDDFSSDPTTAFCHWKIAWDAYLSDKPERVDLLREQVERYPDETHASTALYFLGRIAQMNGNYGEARAYYERLNAQFPHYFYSVLGRERAAEAKVAAAAADEKTAEWLDDIDWPRHRDFSSTVPNAATRARIDRARLLMMAGLPDVADAELRFGAKSDEEQPHLLALELARSMPSPFQALRIMKSFSADYLSMPFESAPLKFWEMLFPMPYKDDLVHAARAHELDPYSVAALIRQESEFNPGAHSHANAFGLMQLIPATGRLMGRQEGIPISGTGALLNPSTNMLLGTHYLQSQLNNWNGDWVETLAAYNAGPGRVKEWLGWGIFREPAEFVESIPFTETREYVQAVLRNADMYRTIYGEKHPNAPEIKDLSEVPPVNLASLPLAARTPGGGVKTVRKSPVVATAKKPAAKKKPAAMAAGKKKKQPA